MKGERKRRFRAAELAWALLSLLAVGFRLRELGWCAGELDCTDVCVTPVGVQRVSATSLWRRMIHSWRRWRHSHSGHEESCFLIGMPRSAFARLFKEWGEPDVVPFVLELVDEVITELRELEVEGLANSGESPFDVAAYVVRSRTTPSAPELGISGLNESRGHTFRRYQSDEGVAPRGSASQSFR